MLDAKQVERWSGKIHRSLTGLELPFLEAELRSGSLGARERVKGAKRDRSHAKRSEHGENQPF
jgi:hypothetical protein